MTGNTARGIGANGVMRLVAGPLVDLVERVWPGEQATSYLGAADGRRQVWHACLVRQAFADVDAAALRGRLTRERGVDLLEAAYGVRLPSLPRALAKLGPVGCAPETYPSLVRLLTEGGAGAKYVRHASVLSEDRVRVLAELPVDQRHAGVPERLGLRRAAELRWHLVRFEAVTGRSAPKIHWRIGGERPETLLVIEAAHSIGVPLPPFPSVGPMQALNSWRELRAAGRAFSNCLLESAQNTALSIASGQTAIYRWLGDEPALVRLNRVPLFGWELVEVTGFKNQDVSHRTRAAIAEWFMDKPDVLVSPALAPPSPEMGS